MILYFFVFTTHCDNLCSLYLYLIFVYVYLLTVCPFHTTTPTSTSFTTASTLNWGARCSLCLSPGTMCLEGSTPCGWEDTDAAYSSVLASCSRHRRHTHIMHAVQQSQVNWKPSQLVWYCRQLIEQKIFFNLLRWSWSRSWALTWPDCVGNTTSQVW